MMLAVVPPPSFPPPPPPPTSPHLGQPKESRISPQREGTQQSSVDRHGGFNRTGGAVLGLARGLLPAPGSSGLSAFALATARGGVEVLVLVAFVLVEIGVAVLVGVGHLGPPPGPLAGCSCHIGGSSSSIRTFARSSASPPPLGLEHCLPLVPAPNLLGLLRRELPQLEGVVVDPIPRGIILRGVVEHEEEVGQERSVQQHRSDRGGKAGSSAVIIVVRVGLLIILILPRRDRRRGGRQKSVLPFPQFALDGAQIHRALDDLEVIRYTQRDRIDGLQERSNLDVTPHVLQQGQARREGGCGGTVRVRGEAVPPPARDRRG
mmetsp:Transcript_30285/g.90191  ORF Transcript_30285/g.90191 Transcript_30285/m.90191 type:complete len:320 (+) Transcript_30285:19-978(+)